MDPFHPLGPIYAFLTKSWPLGRPFGVEVRIGWTPLLVVLVATLSIAESHDLEFSSALGPASLLALFLYATTYTHEMGHVWMGRRYGVPTERITLSALGGLAHMSERPPHPRAEIWIAIAGPLTHVPWIAVAWLLGPHVSPLYVGHGYPIDLVRWLLTMNIGLLCFNLLPCFPMDGGRVLRGLLALRLHPNLATVWTARVGAVGGIVFMALGMSRRGMDGSVLLVIGLNNLLICLRELTAAQYSEGPYAAPRDPWSPDPDAWKQVPRRDDASEGHRGFFRRARGRATPTVEEAPPPPQKERAAPVPGEEDLDRLLDRVNEVGLAGLSEEERATLVRISKAKRAPR